MKILRAMALAALWLLITAAYLELGLRILPQAVPLSVLSQFDPVLRSAIAARRDLMRTADTVRVPRTDGGPPESMWLFKPGTRVTAHDEEEGIVRQVTMDQNGLCNSPYDLYQAPGFDVVAVGDSFTWCTAVAPEETWPARLQAVTGLSTYNAGLPGRGFYEYLQILEHIGLSKHPQAVVIAVYEGNDFRDAHLYQRAHAGKVSAEMSNVCSLTSPLMCRLHAAIDTTPLRRHSYAYNLVSGAIHRAGYVASKREINFRYQVTFPDDVLLEFNSDNGDRDEVQYARWLVQGYLGTNLFDEALERFVALSHEHGFVPVLVYIPSAYTAFEGVSRFDDSEVAASLRAYSWTLRDSFSRRSAELGLRYIDTTPAIQAASRREPSGRRLYFRSNVHLTQRGHEEVARQVAPLLADLPAAKY